MRGVYSATTKNATAKGASPPPEASALKPKCPCAISCRATRPPMNPVAPVTKYFMPVSFHCRWRQVAT